MPSVAPQRNSGSYFYPYEQEQSQWFFKPGDLDKTPSRIEGMSAEEELSNRRKGISFIFQVGIALKLDQTTLATASVYLQRFYMRLPLKIGDKGVHHYQVAATSVYLAYKSKESPRKMHELIVAVSRVAQKDPNLMIDEQSKEYWKWRDSILQLENLMLEVLCLDLDVLLPYSVLYDFLKYYRIQENKKLRNISWAFVNDTCSTTLCLLFRPQVIAGAALYVGCKLADVQLPDDQHERAWWEHLEFDLYEMAQVINIMADTYENPSLPREAPTEAYVKEAEGISFEVTRAPTPRNDEGDRPAYGSGSEEGELG